MLVHQHFHNVMYPRSAKSSLELSIHILLLFNIKLMNCCLTLTEFSTLCTLLLTSMSVQPIHKMVRSGVLSVPRKWSRVRATSLEPSQSICLLCCFLTLHFFLSDKQKLPVSNPLVGFLAHATMADACTELIKLAFKKNKLPIGKGICERLRKRSQDEGRYRHDKITHDEPARVVTNYFK